MAENTVRVFISYSHKDEALRDSLATHLSNLQWQGIISSWYDRQLTAGTEWNDKIKNELESADIILLLISPDFIASKYCRDIEIPMALKQHELKQAYVVPVILRPFDWFDAPFGKLQAFPKDAKAVTTWVNQDEAFVSVTQGIRTAAKLMLEYRKQQTEQKQVIRSHYLQKVEEVLSDGIISIVERDTLDELRETLGLTPEEANEIETRAYEPYSRYEENLNKYKQTLSKLIEKGYYPFNEEIEKDLENRQRDLGLKLEDAARVAKPIIEQAELDYQAKQRYQGESEESQKLERKQHLEQKEYENKLQRYKQEFSKAIQAEYPLSSYVLDGIQSFRQQLGLREEDIMRIERPINEVAEAKYQEKIKYQQELEIQQKKYQYASSFNEAEQPSSPVSIIHNILKVSQEITQEDLGVETLGGIMTVLIPKGTVLPTKKSEIFSTAEDGQSRVDIKVFIGESILTQYNKNLGNLCLEGIPFAKKGVPQIELEFVVNSQGSIYISAKDLGTNNKIATKLNPSLDNLSGFARHESISKSQVNVLNSERGVDYTNLCNLLEKQLWKEADQETTLALLKASLREDKGYFDEQSISKIPCRDLNTVDLLWLKYSKGRFGFTVQKALFQHVAKDKGKFGQAIGWRGQSMWEWKIYKELIFNSEAPSGQFPTLKNQNRGNKEDNYMDAGLGGVGIDCFPTVYARLLECQI
ncbi:MULTISPECIES: GUN4 domain-containing protein [Nostoc]|uniref:GUN4 domain-containing protein n=2 Tax=Nostoc TaxID=1177 RepID=A0ABR8IFQ3_9NOSO|nr:MULTISPECIES: GUN4 domain-containing protein [Nostoc]MBD2564444.1 GUN4 domain-containing protein [Nostoc linckia FACHB-391]MBD2650273.1 GUN4 domain-containing protein [Nostoc foliaceum FACHB-393]